MTHLSDFSFLRMMDKDQFMGQCVNASVYRKNGVIRIPVHLSVDIGQIQLSASKEISARRAEKYNITSVKIKYEEGFANVLGNIFTKPEQMWTKADKALVIPTEYSLVIGFSLQTGTLVLLQCFWNYLANSVAKRNFMSSKEFMFYICWTFSSFIIFPLLQYNFSRSIYDPTIKEIIPEMVYGIGVVSHFRFKKLLRNSRDTPNGRSITQKVLYFQEINIVLSTVLCGHGTLLTILSCDGLTAPKYLNIHKFWADFFICNINMCAVITWLCMILIFHPKHNHSVETTPATDEVYTEDSNKINNNSGISSTNTYGHAPTLVYGNSQASSDYMYKSCHPLTKSGTISSSNCDSAFQFGPLPIIPSTSQATSTTEAFRKNNSIASTAPSMTTLVSHHQVSHGSNGKSNSMYPRSTKGSISASSDYFQVAMPDEKALPSAEDYYDSRASYNNAASIAAAQAASRHYQQQQQQELELQSLRVKSAHTATTGKHDIRPEEEEEYVPPPLSPARKSRGDVIQSLRPEQDRRRYTHSMIIQPCDEDMGEFGIKKKELQPVNLDQELVPGRSPHDGLEEELPAATHNEFNGFQQQQALNNSMLTSFKELGNNTSDLLGDYNGKPKQFMNHSTSSLLLPLPFETSNYSISSTIEEQQKQQSSTPSSSSASSTNNNSLLQHSNVFHL
ncbi:hypothetical protein MUCCIDRAFT_158487 [Mucor lusitanicus CBS 277.49]|uniref:Uncharacterized protein n=1 Tax=Mucor lusitanicus CBS 277.49 TaxID=747725 RepID=A0A162ZWM8_MUCCL|nr:hypothetical protein MUCCIDRAFT_158487 [Mucor lusitanicus CBS 277.49]